MEEKEKPILEAIKEVVSKRRYGRKKVMAKVVKLHPDMSPFRIRRVYVKYGFSLPSKPTKRIRSVKANPVTVPEKKNQSWHVDFMSDALVNGRKIRTFNVIDAFNRECIGIEVGFSMPSSRVTRILDQWIEKHGKPASIRSDNGPEFIAKHFKKWLSNNAIIWEQIRPGSPQENGIVERFNGTYRSEILDANLLTDLGHCKQITQDWIKEYNQERPHESLGFKTPMEYAA
jgi:putative transposase